MKAVLVLVPLLGASLLRVCGAAEEAPAGPVSVTAEVAAPAPAPAPAAPGATADTTLAFAGPAHGGTVVTAGSRRVELVAYRDGVVTAYPVGQPTSSGPQVTATLPGDDGQPHVVVLGWDAQDARYEGRLVEARLAAGPVELALSVEGETVVGRTTTYVLLETPAPPSAIVLGAPPVAPVVAVAAAEPPTVRVEAPSPPSVHVVAAAPSPPVVVVERPRRPRPVVIVEPPRPPSIVVIGPRPRPVVVVEPRRRHDRVIVVERGRGHWEGGGHGRGHGGGHGHGHH